MSATVRVIAWTNGKGYTIRADELPGELAMMAAANAKYLAQAARLLGV